MIRMRIRRVVVARVIDELLLSIRIEPREEKQRKVGCVPAIVITSDDDRVMTAIIQRLLVYDGSVWYQIPGQTWLA